MGIGHRLLTRVALRVACRVSVILPTASCATAHPTECRLGSWYEPNHQRTLADLSSAKPFYNYAAVTRVAPAGHHFTVWYESGEPVVLFLRVTRAAAGQLSIASEGGYWGGLAVGTPTVQAMPANVAALAHDL